MWKNQFLWVTGDVFLFRLVWPEWILNEELYSVRVYFSAIHSALMIKTLLSLTKSIFNFKWEKRPYTNLTDKFHIQSTPCGYQIIFVWRLFALCIMKLRAGKWVAHLFYTRSSVWRWTAATPRAQTVPQLLCISCFSDSLLWWRLSGEEAIWAALHRCSDFWRKIKDKATVNSLFVMEDLTIKCQAGGVLWNVYSHHWPGLDTCC